SSSTARYSSWWIETRICAASFKLRVRGSTRNRPKLKFSRQREDWSASDEPLRPAGRQRLLEWPERGFPGGRVLLHSAQECCSASQVHAVRVYLLGRISNL